MAADLPVPDHVFVHGFLLMDGREDEQVAGQRPRPVRGHRPLRRPTRCATTCLRDVSFGQDGSVSAGAFEARYESELANDYGNLASRTIAMIGRYRDGACARRPARPGARRRLRRAGRPASRELLDQAEVTQALEEIWQRVRRLNRYVEEQRAVEARQGRAGAPASSTSCSRASSRACACSTVLLQPWLPATTEQLLAALGTPDHALEAAQLGARRVGAVRADRAAVPQAAARARRRVIDSHTHLDSCEPAERRAASPPRAPPASRRILTVGMDARDAAARRRWRPSASPRSTLAIGRHPNLAEGFDDRATGRAALVRRARALPGDRRDRPGLLPRPRAAKADQQRAFEAQIELARELGKPLVIHTRAAEDDTIATLARARRRRAGDPALLLDARPPRRVPRAAGWWISFAGNVTYPSAARPRRPPPSACPTTGCSSRPTRRT